MAFQGRFLKSILLKRSNPDGFSQRLQPCLLALQPIYLALQACLLADGQNRFLI